MNYLTNSFVFYIMRVVCSEGVLLTGSGMLDKAQIEKSVLYPAFLHFGEWRGIDEEENVRDLLMKKRKNKVYVVYILKRKNLNTGKIITN